MAKKKTIGVLGGMGPFATISFQQLIMRHSKVEKESDFPRVIIDNNPRIPSRTRSFLYGETSPVDEMVVGVKGLISAGADFIVVPCNSAHYFMKAVLRICPVPFVDMIKETAQILINHNFKKVGVIGGEVTVQGRLYEDQLDKHGVEVVQVSNDKQVKVRRVIEDVKLACISSITHENVVEIIQELSMENVQAIVLACTELNEIISAEHTPIPLFDSSEILADAAVRFSNNVEA